MSSYHYPPYATLFNRVKQMILQDYHIVKKKCTLRTNSFITFKSKRTRNKSNHRKSDRILVAKALVGSGASDSVMIQKYASRLKLDLVKSKLNFSTTGGLTDSSH